MKRPLFLCFIVTLTLAICGIVVTCNTGCETLQSVLTPTTQPMTPADRLAAAQRDLTDTYRIAQDAYLLGILSEQQWKLLQGAYPVAQDAINLAGVALADGEPTALDLLDKAAQAVADYRKIAPKTGSQ
jgi:hypothetical protein